MNEAQPVGAFNFQTVVPDTSWLVESLIPFEQLGIMLAQAGVGKSLLVEDLATSLVFGIPFCGFKTIEGDVLLIDQDTPTDVLYRRLLRFARAMGLEPKHNLFIKSMGGYSLDNGTLASMISDYPTVCLAIVDSLHSVCGRLNPNYTSDMNRLAQLKERCLRPDLSIIVNHHISQKWELSIDALMQGDPNRLAMGNSAIIQQCDTYYVIGARAEQGETKLIYVRPVSRRVSIPLDPVVLKMIPKNEGEMLDYEGRYEPDLDEAEYDVMTLFAEQDIERTVKEAYEAMGQKHGIIKVRKAMASLEVKGKLRVSRHRANLFKYRLP